MPELIRSAPPAQDRVAAVLPAPTPGRGANAAASATRNLALLGDSATQFFVKALRESGQKRQLDFSINEADFDQIDAEILDSESALYRSKPEFIIIYSCVERLWARFAGMIPEEKSGFAEQVLLQIHNRWKTIAERSTAKIIQLNFAETDEPAFGAFASKTQGSFLYQLRKINFELMNLAQTARQVFIADVASLSAQTGYTNAHDPRLYAAYHVAFGLDFLPRVSEAITDIIEAATGKLRKCLILDLDNTIWGGVVGDDGVENIQLGELGLGPAYDEVQRWARELKNRGVILAVCSKNEEAAAKAPFREHPDMLLRLDDIAVFVANWESKADNIRYIQQVLEIGFDSMVFLDDNPFERNLVRQMLPAVTVPELPEDPCLFARFLRSLNLFETGSFSAEDLERTRQYQQEQTRRDFQKSFTSIDDYLLSLEMKSIVRPFDDFSVPRVAQLTQRSNQFNLRTVRYSEAEIDCMRKSDKFATLAFTLEDKFGDHGLIATVILQMVGAETAFINTWIMSCRVLKRSMEEFIVNQIASCAKERGIRRLEGEYIPTPKNGLVKDLYPRLGFLARNGGWELDVEKFQGLKTLICPK